MSKFEISYYYDDPWAGTVEETTTFEGDWTGLQEYIKGLKEMECYGIIATDIAPEWYEDDAELAE